MEDWWRVLVVILALGLTVAEVSREVVELTRSHRKLRTWRRWLERRVHDDLHRLHPMWPQVSTVCAVRVASHDGTAPKDLKGNGELDPSQQLHIASSLQTHFTVHYCKEHSPLATITFSADLLK